MFEIILIFVFIVWILVPLYIVINIEKGTPKTLINYLAVFCLFFGGIGFLGTAMVSTGMVPFPKSIAWPVGNSDKALAYPEGYIIVPHDSSGRVQIYDESLQFIRGWNVEAYGGTFSVQPGKDGTFYVKTARGDKQYHYDVYGFLLSAETLQGYYNERTEDHVNVTIPTPFFLMIFITPFGSWAIAAIGMILLFATGEANRFQDRLQNNSILSLFIRGKIKL